MSNYREETILTSAAVTATGTTPFPGESYGNASTLRLHAVVSAASGTTPTLDIVVEDTLDGVNFFVVGTFTQITAAASQAVNVTSPFCERLRLRYTLGGTTPSFTLGVRCAYDPQN